MADEVRRSEERQASASGPEVAKCYVGTKATYQKLLHGKSDQEVSRYKDAIIQEIRITNATTRKLDAHINILNATTRTDLQVDTSSLLQAVNEELAFEAMKSARQIRAECPILSDSNENGFGLSDSLATPIISELSEQQNSVLERFRTSPFTNLDSFLQYERDMSELKHYRKSVPGLTKRLHQSVQEVEQMEQALYENELELTKLRELKSEVTKDLAMADARGLVWQSEIRELEEFLEANTGLANVGAHAVGGILSFWIRYAYESGLLWRERST